MSRKIAVVTGIRADYGLLRWIMQEIEDDGELELQLMVTGAHLSHEFGMSYRQIEADGFHIDAKVDMLLSGDSDLAVTKSLGLGVIGFADALQRLQPDMLLVLGDRYEILAAAQAAMIAKIPIAHVHGGETTVGVIDEAIRHAMTKMSHLHFVTAPEYAHRVTQMGEHPRSVQVVGAPGLDNFERLQLLGRVELEKTLGFRMEKTNFLLTYHPVTLAGLSPQELVKPLLTALDHFPNAGMVITGSNADPTGRTISSLLSDYAASCGMRVCYRENLGSLRYLSLLQHVDVVIGNSSSGLIEAPSCGAVTVNIGDRQKNRLRAPSVIDCELDATAIQRAIEQGLSPEIKAIAAKCENPYGAPGAAVKIKERLKSVMLDGILFKSFYDLPQMEQATIE